MDPPPTFNTLDSYQRARLLRTSRKLGAVLGTTPFVLEPTEIHTLDFLLPIGPTHQVPVPETFLKAVKKSRRKGSVFHAPSHPHAASRSVSSLDTTLSSPAQSREDLRLRRAHSQGRSKSKSKGPYPLILQINTVPVEMTDYRIGTHAEAMPSPPPSPVSALHEFNIPRLDVHITRCTLTRTEGDFERMRAQNQALRRKSSYFERENSLQVEVPPATPSSPSTPLTPSFRFRANAIPAVRRRKIAKLAQRFGEGVPTELVFNKSRSRSGSFRGRPRSGSVSSLMTATPQLPARVPVRPALPHPPPQTTDPIPPSKSSTTVHSLASSSSTTLNPGVEDGKSESLFSADSQPRRKLLAKSKSCATLKQPRVIPHEHFPTMRSQPHLRTASTMPNDENHGLVSKLSMGVLRSKSRSRSPKEAWQGEWNATNYADVMRKLRELR